jgi:hypothetical protein
MHEYEFVNLGEPSPEEILVPDDRFAALSALCRDVVVNACIHQTKSVIFMRQGKRNAQKVEMIASFAAHCDFATYFSQSSLEDLSARFDGNHQLTFEQRLAAPRQITNILRMNVNLVAAPPDACPLIRALSGSIASISPTTLLRTSGGLPRKRCIPPFSLVFRTVFQRFSRRLQ